MRRFNIGIYRKFKEAMNRFRIDKRFISILFWLGISLCLISSVKTNILWTPLEYKIGILASLPLTFWLGYILSLLSMIYGIKFDKEIIFFLKATIVFSIFMGIPSLFLKNPYDGDAYLTIKLVNNMVKNAFVNISSTFENVYEQFPFIVLFVGMLKLILGISTDSIGRYFLLLSSGITFLTLYGFMKVLSGEENFDYKSVSLSTSFGLVWMQYHMVPQSLALFSIFILIWSILKPKFFPWRVISIIAILASVTNHPPSTLFILSVLILFILLNFIFSKSYMMEHKKYTLISILFGVIWISWLSYLSFGSSGIFRLMVNIILSSFKAEEHPNYASILEGTGAKGFWENYKFFIRSYYGLTGAIRTFSFLFNAFLSSILLFILSIWKNKFNRFNILGISWLISGAIFIFFSLFKQLHLNMGDRGYLFFYILTIPIILAGLGNIKLSTFKRKAILAVLIICVLGNALTKFRDSNQYIIPDQRLVVDNFLYQKGERQPIITYNLSDSDSFERRHISYIAFIDRYSELWARLSYGQFKKGIDLYYKKFKRGIKFYNGGIITLVYMPF